MLIFFYNFYCCYFKRTYGMSSQIYGVSISPQEGLAPINLIVENELHRATPGGTGGVKTIGNYAAVSQITCPFLLFLLVH